MIGLGRMGGNMTRRLMQNGHQLVVYDVNETAVEKMAAEGAIPAGSLLEFMEKLEQPRAVWMMIPAALVDQTIEKVAPLMNEGDMLIDGGNSYYRDDLRRSKKLVADGIHYLDVGVSGGVWGQERGYCLMIGGNEAACKHLDPIFKSLGPGENSAPRTPGRGERAGTAVEGYLRCGSSGAGHFVKMVHNGIEYGLMAAYAEGLNLLAHANVGTKQRDRDAETAPIADPEAYSYDLDIPEITELWRRGTVIASWLLDLTADALARDSTLKNFTGRVSDSGEGRWTIRAAVESGSPAPVLATALFERFSTRAEAQFADKILSAMRSEFGGHAEKKGASG